MIQGLSRMEHDGARFRHVTQNGTNFKTYELFISELSHLIFLDHSGPQVNEIRESETTDKEGLL